VRQAAYFAIV